MIKMTLLEKQKVFSRLLARLIDDLYRRGYEVTLGEVWRPSEMAKIYASTGKGIPNSNHTIRLAADLNIFFDNVYLDTKDELEIAGEIWKSYSCDLFECCWGGDFKMIDAHHFSIEHNGIR